MQPFAKFSDSIIVPACVSVIACAGLYYSWCEDNTNKPNIGYFQHECDTGYDLFAAKYEKVMAKTVYLCSDGKCDTGRNSIIGKQQL